MSIALVILLGTMSLQAANAQNSSSNNSNIGTAKAHTANGTAKAATANGSKKTVVIAAPSAAATVVTTGNKMIIQLVLLHPRQARVPQLISIEPASLIYIFLHHPPERLSQ
ncbi:MAG: hypothetical protein M3044_05505 [Thermoproteota archaeon]|nr:hypothetical protein [Thermoproteota archaeon]